MFKIYQCLAVLLLWLAPFTGYAQKPALKDTTTLLEHLAAHPQNDTGRVILLNKLANAYSLKNRYTLNSKQACFIYGLEALKLSLELKWPAGLRLTKALKFDKYYLDKDNSTIKKLVKSVLTLAEQQTDDALKNNTYQTIGDIYLGLEQDNAARLYYKKAEMYFDQKKDIPQLMNVIFDLSSTYDFDGDERQPAIELLQRDITLAKSINDKKSLGTYLYTMGKRMYFSPTAAISYFKQAAEIQESINDNHELIYTYVSMAYAYAYENMKDYRKSIAIATTGISICKKNRLTNGFFMFYEVIANDYVELKDYKEAEANYKRAIACSVNPSYLGQAYRSLRSYYVNRSDYVKAIDAAEKQLINYKKGEDIFGIAVSYDEIAEIYAITGNTQKALNSYKLSFKLYNDIENKFWPSAILLNIGDLYLKQHADTAIIYYNKALRFADSVKSLREGQSAYVKLARVYFQVKDYEKSLANCVLATKDTTQIYDRQKAQVYQTYAGIYRDAPIAFLTKHGISPSKRYMLAIQWLDKSKKKLTRSSETELERDQWNAYALTYQKQNNYVGAFDAYQQYIALRDSITNQQAQHAFAQREAGKEADSLKYTEKLTNENLKQQKQLNTQQTRYYLTGISALLLISFFVVRNAFNQRKSNRMLTSANEQISAEKQRSDDLLLNILPADVAEELKQTGTSDARLFDEVTVLFTDFVNFTAISELLTPQELVNELHFCFKAFDDIMTTHHIEKIKTIGDAYLAVAGLPHADPDHATNTIRAALEITRFIHDRKQLLGDKTFEIRIGIHSGSVVAGIVGVKKFAYDIWGDTVNTAARMEQNSEPGKINVSEKTYELVKHQFAFTYRGEIAAKNKGAFKMYFVE